MKDALKLALEALEIANSLIDNYYIPKGKEWLPEIEEAITAIKQALAAPVQENTMIYKTFEQWMDGNFLEVKEPRKKAYSKDELLLVEMGWSYGYDAGRAVEQALNKKAENARELGLDYEPVVEFKSLQKRWEDGDDHDPRSETIYKYISDMDFKHCGDSFCFKSGGDGDNGETLMFILDCWFDQQPTTPPAAQPAPVQEPVAYLVYDKGASCQYLAFDDELGDMDGCEVEPLYTTPPNVATPLAAPAPEERKRQSARSAWVGLTATEQGAIMEDLKAHGTNLYHFARAIEAKLKEKNT